MQGGYVHATVRGGIGLGCQVTEGMVYIISNFRIEENKSLYRVVSDSKILLRFVDMTTVQVADDHRCRIPRHRFDFVEFGTLENRREKIFVLSDVYGALVSEHVDETQLSDERITVRLCEQAYSQFNTLGYDDVLFFVVVTSTLVKGSTTDSLCLGTTASSKVYLTFKNPETSEMGHNFRAMSSRCIRETIAEPASIGAFIMTRDIASIMDHCEHPYAQDLVCRCLATVTRIRAGLPWYNYECPDCGTRLNMESESIVCHYVGCNRVIVKPNILYRLELEVEDTTGRLALTVFNKQVQDMVKTDAEEMRARELSKGMLTETGVAYQVPREIREAFEGMAFVFTLKIDDFNHNSILTQSFNVEEIKEASELEGGHGREEHTLRRWGKRPWGLDGCEDEVQEGATSTNEHKHVRVSER